ncbi:MAG: glycerol-3-phosphate 1-O-acyltransferase PlsY [Cyanobacteria bacterium P01_F01_bin.53]
MSGSTIAILVLGLLAAYLLGSIPTGFVLAKVLKGIDIREHGSGNTGATNVFRVLGKGPGITALVIDLLKGVVAVLLMQWLVRLAFAWGASDVLEGGLIYGNSPDAQGYVSLFAWASMLSALLAVIGHSKSVWLGFTGGKSAATGLGVLLALSWPVGLGVAAVFSVALALSRTVSVGSISAAFSAGLLMLAMKQPLAYVLLAIAGGLYVIVRHQANISRLMAGTEPKTFDKKTADS